MNGLTYPFSLTNIASRPQNIVNDIFTPLTVISNTYVKDVLIKEVSQLFSPDRSLTSFQTLTLTNPRHIFNKRSFSNTRLVSKFENCYLEDFFEIF